MATLTNTQISVTYVGLLKTSANTVLTSTAQQITDGSGNNSILYLSTAGVGIGGSPASGKELDVTGNVQVTGDLIVDNITIDGSTITNTSGDLTIVNTNDDGDVIFQSDNQSGGVETYFFLDGSTGFTQFPDNKRLVFGSANDLVLLHDGTDSFIKNETGNLEIRVDEADKDIVFKSDDASGGVTTYFKLDGSAGFTVVSKKFRFEDNINLTLGTADDLSLFHDSTDSTIKNTTGDLIIKNDATDKEIIFKAEAGGSTNVEYLSIGGSNEFTKVSKDFRFIDNTKARFGTSDDLEIFHDGSNSRINETGTGNLIIQSTNFQLLKDDGGEFIMQGISDAEVALYFDGSKKFETTSGGINVTGGATFSDNITINASTLTISGTYPRINLTDTNNDDDFSIINNDGSFAIFNVTDALFSLLIDTSNNATFAGDVSLADSKKIKLGDSGDLEIYHSGSNSFIQDAGTGGLVLLSNQTSINNASNSEDIAKFIADGAVELYHDNSKKFETTSTGVTVTGGVIASGDGSFGTSGATNNSSVKTLDGSIITKIQSQTAGDTAGILGTESNDVLKLVTNNTTALTLDTSQNATFAGNVTINKASNPSKLQIGSSLADDPFIHFQTDGENYSVGVDRSDSNKFKISNGSTVATNTRITLATSGFLGIGTTSPSTIFEVKQTNDGNVNEHIRLWNNGGSSGTGNKISFGAGSTYAEKAHIRGFFASGGTGQLAISVNGTDALSFDSSQNATFAGNITLNGSHTITNDSNGHLNINSASGKQIFIDAQGQLRLDSGGAQALTLSSSQDASFTGNVSLADAKKLKLGANADLTAHHSGTDSFISNSTGHLTIQNSADDKDILFLSDDGSGGTTEYMRLDGGTTSIVVSASLGMYFNDGIAARFGNSGDFIAFHDGTDSFLSNDVGDVTIRNNANDKDIIFQSDDGSGGTATYFFLDGSENRVTSNKNFRFIDNAKVKLGTSGDLQIYHDGSNSYVEQTGTGDLIIQNSTDDKDILLQTDNGSGLVTSYIQLDGSDLSTKILTQKVILSNLPTSDPNNAGQLYNESGFLRVSAG
jgi:hemin uptake protein HemP